jgi:ABC-type antimicrobial peptide transport system permease subunit
MVFGVTTADPVSYGTAAAVFLVVGLIAVAIPARRGSSIEPTTALRCE